MARDKKATAPELIVVLSSGQSKSNAKAAAAKEREAKLQKEKDAKRREADAHRKKIETAALQAKEARLASSQTFPIMTDEDLKPLKELLVTRQYCFTFFDRPKSKT